MGQRLVELSDEVRDSLLVTVVHVAGGPDLEFSLSDLDAPPTGYLRTLRRLFG